MVILFYLLLLADTGAWHCEADQRGLWHCAAAASVATAAPQLPAPELPAPEPAAVVVGQYVVQLGAYRQRQHAQLILTELDTEDVAMVSVQLAGEAWYLLLMGAYPDAASARVAADLWLQRHPQTDYWIRHADEIRRLQLPVALEASAQ